MRPADEARINVSIHAPWEGCDAWVSLLSNCYTKFQFTHPGKGATYDDSPLHIAYEFQFTHPGKGATYASMQCYRMCVVSIHAPWEGCDCLRQGSCTSLLLVSIHAPWEGCDLDEGWFCCRYDEVSIHAPWEGCDTFGALSNLPIATFQFTHPGKGATNQAALQRMREQFQFTHPGKGATVSSLK